MLKSDVSWPDCRRFKSHSEWEPIGFFSEGFCNALQFDLKLGFFSSSAIQVMADSFALFLYHGGTMRLIINDILSDKDKHAIIDGQSDKSLKPIDLSNLSALQETLGNSGTHFFDCLAWLIRNERISIKIVSPKNSQRGISHFKCGCFSDAQNKVAFDGSCNFSRTALVENNESITAFCDWDGGRDLFKIKDIEQDFERTFSGKDETVDYVDAHAIRSQIEEMCPDKELENLLEDENALLEKRLTEVTLSDSIRKVLLKAKKKVGDALKTMKLSASLKEPDDVVYNEPSFPYPSGPRAYQKQAFENWLSNKQKGLFAMATGTGKTLTALNCLLEVYKRKGYYKALILVPTLTLVEQWEKECRKFHFSKIYKVSSRNSNWRNDIERLHMTEKYGKSESVSYVIITTYASFVKQGTFEQLTAFSKNQLLLIADEAHNMGSKRILDLMEGIKYVRRIGLSATPERQFDDEGNLRVKRFFGVERDRYTFEFTMREAIDKGFLCRYYYYPHLVRLQDLEMRKYMEISVKLARLFNADRERFTGADECLTRLLLKRKQIIHKAENKIEVFKRILEKRYQEKGNLQYTLVYVPEGNQQDDEDADDLMREDDAHPDAESSHLIDLYTQIVRNVSPTTTVKEFTANSKDREQVLADFAAGRLEVLTSMKCLDEGVDVPRSEWAIFCASTGNPRQFIQRRGRILRQHDEKHCAVIHDLVVAPEVTHDSTCFKMERNLLGNELRRVRDFALMSENADAAYKELEAVLDYYELSI